MLEVLRIHWKFVRHPQYVIENYVRQWPIGLGLGIYVIWRLTIYMAGASTSRMHVEILSTFAGEYITETYYLTIIGTMLYSLLIQWYAMPLIVKRLSPVEPERIDVYLYRKLVLMSGTGYVIFMTFTLLPVRAALMTYVASADDVMNLPLSLTVLTVNGLSGLWAVVCAIMALVIVWKGLGAYFELTAGRKLLVMFVFPLILYLPIGIPSLYIVYQYLIQKFIS